MEKKIEYALNYLLDYWSFFYFLRPVVLIVIIYSLYQILKARVRNEFSRLCKTYLICAGLIFAYMEPVTFLRIIGVLKVSHGVLSKYFEVTASIFQVVEFYIFYSIINLAFNDRKISLIRNFGTGFLILLIPVLFHFISKSTSFQITLFDGEMFAGISNALLLPGFILFTLYCYRQSIHSTYTLPTILGIFCYVITSLLIYPCTAFLFKDYQNLSFLLYCYHYVVMVIMVLTMKYNITKVQEGPNKFIVFNI